MRISRDPRFNFNHRFQNFSRIFQRQISQMSIKVRHIKRAPGVIHALVTEAQSQNKAISTLICDCLTLADFQPTPVLFGEGYVEAPITQRIRSCDVIVVDRLESTTEPFSMLAAMLTLFEQLSRRPEVVIVLP